MLKLYFSHTDKYHPETIKIGNYIFTDVASIGGWTFRITWNCPNKSLVAYASSPNNGIEMFGSYSYSNYLDAGVEYLEMFNYLSSLSIKIWRFINDSSD